jgi:hypothetical protein
MSTASIPGKRILTPLSLKVVVMSKGTDYLEKGFTREEAEGITLGKDFTKEMNEIFRLGVPVVLASGNEGDKGRKLVDNIPQVLQNEQEDERKILPIINVGAATLDGKVMSWSPGQGTKEGTKLTVYRVGDNVDFHGPEDGKKTQASGTSIAAPAVAGIIAVHLNYSPRDQSKTGIKRVKEISRWITTSESSFERTENQEFRVNLVSLGCPFPATVPWTNHSCQQASLTPRLDLLDRLGGQGLLDLLEMEVLAWLT